MIIAQYCCLYSLLWIRSLGLICLLVAIAFYISVISNSYLQLSAVPHTHISSYLLHVSIWKSQIQYTHTLIHLIPQSVYFPAFIIYDKMSPPSFLLTKRYWYKIMNSTTKRQFSEGRNHTSLVHWYFSGPIIVLVKKKYAWNRCCMGALSGPIS